MSAIGCIAGMGSVYRLGMSKRTKKDPTAWRNTTSGGLAYSIARSEAQAKANATGFDHGIEANDLFKSWNVFMLPNRDNRRGHELMCEVVMCEDMSKCQMGHGPR